MKKIIDVIEDSFLIDPCLESALNEKYANVSEVARHIYNTAAEPKPSIIAIISALKRRERKKSESVLKTIRASSITVKTGLAKVSFEPTDSDLDILEKDKDKLIGFTKGLGTVTLLVEEKAIESLISQIKGAVLEKKSGLAAIVITGPIDILGLPGFMSFFLNILNSKGINVDDLASSYVDVMIILSEKDASSAFGFFSEAIEIAKRQFSS